eukprot:s4822_g8.t1
MAGFKTICCIRCAWEDMMLQAFVVGCIGAEETVNLPVATVVVVGDGWWRMVQLMVAVALLGGFMVLEWLLPVEQETSGEAQTSQTLTLYGSLCHRNHDDVPGYRSSLHLLRDHHGSSPSTPLLPFSFALVTDITIIIIIVIIVVGFTLRSRRRTSLVARRCLEVSRCCRGDGGSDQRHSDERRPRNKTLPAGQGAQDSALEADLEAPAEASSRPTPGDPLGLEHRTAMPARALDSHPRPAPKGPGATGPKVSTEPASACSAQSQEGPTAAAGYRPLLPGQGWCHLLLCRTDPARRTPSAAFEDGASLGGCASAPRGAATYPKRGGQRRKLRKPISRGAVGHGKTRVSANGQRHGPALRGIREALLLREAARIAPLPHGHPGDGHPCASASHGSCSSTPACGTSRTLGEY